MRAPSGDPTTQVRLFWGQWRLGHGHGNDPATHSGRDFFDRRSIFTEKSAPVNWSRLHEIGPQGPRCAILVSPLMIMETPSNKMPIKRPNDIVLGPNIH
ncbi:hypothetical protein GWI33_011307 [Rhynchophorus ferrugineus]|uniref:Uncharacterized protein n=1 Tax=Rhynchophorus ferrugineus TaxID=354439 RepID=A0A834I9V8_RHYFE|nr:hypothetical protein GWI33_011307 [Rhynchophorus ferrugineus]